MALADDVPNRLAVYGSLAPGEPNHWVVSKLQGTWEPGTATGYLFDLTWGPADGYAGFIPDADGNPVPVAVLHSEQLEKNWRSIDDFEGDGYERRVITVSLDSGVQVQACIYVALTDS